MPTAIEVANAALKRAQDQLAAAEASVAAAEHQVIEPRSPEVVIGLFMDQVAMRLGNRPELRQLIAEFKNATKLPAATPHA